ncbi:CheR family methyltransferase [Paracoccus xiamenensis]|uniref:CheR family methyltransferase n=1 Tax=Paracoccus xiamenensis TaxID=2714901 RepID=UPI0014083B0F|nr:protein-glutamate O-methyltransferase CheR [Paracoccus xiamenensis]NHF73222.1 protein-glutamate O-methyltransferase CheR [Paracoccus xiamenensis]
MTSASFSPREVALNDHDFDQLRQIIYTYAGIVIGPEKRSMMRARLQKRVAALGLGSMAEYLKLVSGARGVAEREKFISSLTTNVTSFFRENHHFGLLKEAILPPLVAEDRQISIWSAGCSSGQEPYSIAMTIHDFMPSLAPLVHITASDIDMQILEKAKRATYKPAEMAGVRPGQRAKYFQPAANSTTPDDMQVVSSLKSMIEFRQINLNTHWPIIQHYDVIFFRNVAIYFDADTQRTLWRKFHGALRPGGWMLIGHSERVPNDQHDILRPSGITAYRRPN